MNSFSNVNSRYFYPYYRFQAKTVLSQVGENGRMYAPPIISADVCRTPDAHSWRGTGEERLSGDVGLRQISDLSDAHIQGNGGRR